jgi:hypothetical protein
MSKAGHVLSVLAILVTLAGCGGGAVGPANASHTILSRGLLVLNTAN